MRAVELWRNFQVRRCKPDPLGAHVVHVREDRRNGAGFAWRLGFPRGRVETLNQHLVDALVSGKNLDRGSAELRRNFTLARGHGSLLLDLKYFWAVGWSETNFYLFFFSFRFSRAISSAFFTLSLSAALRRT